MTGPLRNDAATSAFLRWPVAVVDLACLGALISASVLVLTTAGITQLLSQAGSDALPAVYILLAGVSIPLASTHLRRARAAGRRR